MRFVLFKFLSRWLPNLLIFKGCRAGPPVDGPKDPWPRVLGAVHILRNAERGEGGSAEALSMCFSLI